VKVNCWRINEAKLDFHFNDVLLRFILGDQYQRRHQQCKI